MKAEGAKAIYWKGKCELCPWAFEVSVPDERHPNRPLYWRCGYYGNENMAAVSSRGGCTGPKPRESTRSADSGGKDGR